MAAIPTNNPSKNKKRIKIITMKKKKMAIIMVLRTLKCSIEWGYAEGRVLDMM